MPRSEIAASPLYIIVPHFPGASRSFQESFQESFQSFQSFQESYQELTAEGVGVLTRCVDAGEPPKLEEISYSIAWKNISSFSELRAACKRLGIRLVGIW